MTENLLQKLEEKMMMLLTELEDKRKEIQEANREIQDANNEVQRLTHEMNTLKSTQASYSSKIADLLSLLDIAPSENNMAANAMSPAMKPVLVQG